MNPNDFLASLKTQQDLGDGPGIVLYPEPVLRAIAEPVEDLKPWTRIASTMFDLMVKFSGCGLAAPQVGLSYRMFVLNINKPIVVINPEILEWGNRLWEAEEGCLSIPGKKVIVSRPRKIKAQWIDLDGKKQVFQFEGWTARAFQHEFDHLLGRLIIDFVEESKEQKGNTNASQQLLTK